MAIENENPGALAGATGARDQKESLALEAGTIRAKSQGHRKERRSEHWSSLAEFFQERQAFITRQVLLDAGLRPTAAQTMNAIVMHTNFEKGYATVAYETITAAFGVSDDRITRDLKNLEKRGHCRIERYAGPNGTHKVWWVLKPETQQGAFRGLEHENTEVSENKAGGIRKRAADLSQSQDTRPQNDKEATANLRTLEASATSANLPASDRKFAVKGTQICGTNIQSNIQQNTQVGGRALGRASASTSEVVSDYDVIEDFIHTRLEQNAGRAPEGAPGFDRFNVDDPDTDARRELAALEAPPPASDRSIPVAMDARPFASEPDSADALIPISAADGKGGDLRGQALTMADLDRIAADERDAVLILADKVSGVFPHLRNADGFVSDLLAGFTQRQDDLAAARATKTALVLLMQAEGHEAAALKWRQLLSILSRAMQADQILALRNAVAAAMIEQRNRKSTTSQEAAHVQNR